MALIEISIGSEKRQVPAGTILRELSLEYQAKEAHAIVMAEVDGRLKELRKTIDAPCSIRWVTLGEADGMRAYERSAQMLMNKVICQLLPKDKLKEVISQFSLNGGIFVELRGMEDPSEELVKQLEDRMHQLVEEDISFEKTQVKVDQAIRMFAQTKMIEKVKLFRYRRSSSVNLYFLGGFADYYYGYMLPSTAYLKTFALEKFDQGIVLRLPTFKDPEHLAPMPKQDKLFKVMMQTTEWGDQLGLSTVGDINDWIAQGRAEDMVLIAEAKQEAEIARIAEEIASRPEIKFVLIAGPSSSGKTSFSNRLSIQLRTHGLRPHPVAVDDYFVNRELNPKDENGNYDFEALECVDVKKFEEDMNALLAGETIPMPSFDFVEGKRRYEGKTLTVGPDDILVIEGIHCLNPKMSQGLPEESKFRIYVSALSSLNIDEHNRVRTTDLRLVRRMIRDARTRGSSARSTIGRWASVRKGEEKNIFPYQESADAMFDSSLIYEFPVMKIYAEQLLYGIDKTDPEYIEAKRLLKFFDYILGIPSDAVPRNSLVKEFIGGSIFKV